MSDTNINMNVTPYYPHPYRSKENGYRECSEVLKGPYTRIDYCKHPATGKLSHPHITTMVDYRFKNKKGKWVEITEYPLQIIWLTEQEAEVWTQDNTY